MTTKELRELDHFVAEHVMGWKWIGGPNVWSVDSTTSRNFHPTILASDAMDVLKKCATKVPSIVVSKWDTQWGIGSSHARFGVVKDDSLELAICLFAKQLFSQTTK